MDSLISKKNTASDQALSPGAIVMFEQQGTSFLGVVTGGEGPKITVQTESDETLELHANRLSILGGSGGAVENPVQFLKKLRKDSARIVSFKDIKILWEKVQPQGGEYSIEELAAALFSDYTLTQITGLRFKLIEERLYFKRKKNTFLPRKPEHVAQSQAEFDKEREQQRLEKETIAACKKKILDPTYELPRKAKRCLYPIKCLAASAKRIPQAQQKEAKRFFRELNQELGFILEGPIERQTYSLLRKLGEFSADTNLALIRHNISSRFRKREVEAAHEVIENLAKNCGSYSEDLTHLHCVTIDDQDTRDMDDAVSVREIGSGFELGIHISNVAGAIPFTSPLEHTARRRGTSLYLTDRVIPMLPESLSTDGLSLCPEAERYTISVLFNLDSEYRILTSRIVPAKIKVAERLNYTDVDSEMETANGLLFHLYQIACVLEADRFLTGGFKVPKREAMLRLREDGTLQLEEVDENSPARMVIGELMIIANRTFADLAIKNNVPLLFRSQPGPDTNKFEQAEALPEGLAREYVLRTALKPSSSAFTPGFHSTLGAVAYAQVTSPIRRYGDLCNQRQILNVLLGKDSFFTEEKFSDVIKESEASSQYSGAVSKETRRFWFLRYLQQEKKNLEKLEATVLRNDMKSPLVQLHDLYLPVLLNTNAEKYVGEQIVLKIVRLSPTFDELQLEEIG